MKNILLVDDDISILYLLGCALKSKGIETSKATNGVEAVKILKGKSFGMMITDFKMPRMDGIELEIIAKRLQPDIHIINRLALCFSQSICIVKLFAVHISPARL